VARRLGHRAPHALPTFVFWNALGGIAWSISVGMLACLLGPTAERAFEYIDVIGIAVTLLLGARYVTWRHVHRRRHSASPLA
jgi:membrane protein DedA with SNARE-associated domain